MKVVRRDGREGSLRQGPADMVIFTCTNDGFRKQEIVNHALVQIGPEKLLVDGFMQINSGLEYKRTFWEFDVIQEQVKPEFDESRVIKDRGLIQYVSFHEDLSGMSNLAREALKAMADGRYYLLELHSDEDNGEEYEFVVGSILTQLKRELGFVIREGFQFLIDMEA